MVRNIVFDMGMVLMDFHPMEASLAAAGNEADARALYEALFAHPEWVRLDDGTITQEELGRRAQARLTHERLRPLVSRVLDAMPGNILRPIPGMDSLVDWVLEAGFRVYLLSNAGLMVSEHREIIPRIEKFHGVVFSAEEGVIKPDPRIYARLTERYGLLPEECLFIDDNPANTEGARKLGWQTYTYGGDLPALRTVLQGHARALAAR
ncbi:MAG: HAD family phosphatase [Clostridiales bacterium]|nr:HAD family phosphatase [Clostridiales bacterium]